MACTLERALASVAWSRRACSSFLTGVCLLVDRLLRDVPLREQMLDSGRDPSDRSAAFAGPGERRFGRVHRVDALRDRQLPLIDVVAGGGVLLWAVATSAGARLQVGGVELRQELALLNGVALLDVDRVGGLGRRALDRDVLIRRDDAGERSAPADDVPKAVTVVARKAAGAAGRFAAAAAGAQEREDARGESPAGGRLRVIGWPDCTGARMSILE